MIDSNEASGTAGAGTTSPGSPPCLSDLAFDRLIGGELAAPARLAAQRHLDRCPRCQERLGAMQAEAQAFATLAPPLPARSDVPSEPRPQSRRRWRAAGAGGALAAAALAGWLLQVRPEEGPAPGAERTKGSGGLGYFVKRGAVVREGRADEPLHPGDAIQFVYRAPADGFLAIVSVDGQGRASVYYPTGPQAAPVAAGRAQPLPQSTVLDGTLGRETIHAFFCPRPVSLEPLRAALASRPAAPPAPADCAVETLSFDKTRAP